MKYWVIVKSSGERIEGKAIAQIARDLHTTYATVYKSLLYSLNPELPKGRKLSQKNFDDKYEVIVADPFLGQLVEIKA